MKGIIGIDPGTKGAISKVFMDGSIVYDPLPYKNLKGTSKQVIDMDKMRSLITDYYSHGDHVFLEYPDTPFGWSKEVAKKLTHDIGVLEGLFYAWYINWAFIKPQDWQQLSWKDTDIVKKITERKSKKKGIIKVFKTDTKQSSINAATRIWPEQDFLYGEGEKKRKPYRTDPTARGFMDAALIANAGHLIVHAKEFDIWKPLGRDVPYPGRSNKHKLYLESIKNPGRYAF